MTAPPRAGWDRWEAPAVIVGEAAILLPAAALAVAVYARGAGFFPAVAVFYFGTIGVTLALLKLFRSLFPFREGVFTRCDHPREFFLWRVYTFLAMTNLFAHYQGGVLPPPVRKFMSRLLGARVGKGLINVSGVIGEPSLVTLEERAVVGHGAVLLPADDGVDRVTLGRIFIGAGAVVGGRCVLMPGVTVGAGAMIKGLSWVPAGTTIPPHEVWGGIPARKEGDMPRPPAGQPVQHFMGWRDRVITPAVSLGLFAAAAGLTWATARRADPFTAAAVFYGFGVGVTLLFLKVFRMVSPFREGVFSLTDKPAACFQWSLQGFLFVTNLFLHSENGLLPPVLRVWFYRFLGSRIQRGHLSFSGFLTDPALTHFGEGVTVGRDALIASHALTDKSLVLKGVTVERGATVGARAFLFLGVTVGEGARVESLSLVALKRIPPYEVWAGVPARKIGERPRPTGAGPRPRVWREAALIVSTEVVVAALSIAGAAVVFPAGGVFGVFLVFAVGAMGWTVALLAVLRALFPFQEGVLARAENPWGWARWKLHNFLCMNNLFLFHQNGLIPPWGRGLFARLLGADLRASVRGVSGLIDDPFFVSLEKGAVVEHDALLLPHDFEEGRLTLGRIRVGRGAVVGCRAVLLPGVVLGDGARVEPLSLVSAHTRIPAGEVWGGIPARKRADASTPDDSRPLTASDGV